MQRMLWMRAALAVGAMLGLNGCTGGSAPDVVDARDGGFTDVEAAVPDADAGTDAADDGTMMARCGAGLGECNPVTNGGCAAGQACAFAGGRGMCVMAGTGGFDQPCMFANDCREGFACLGFSAPDGGVDRRCRPLCCGPEDFERCRDETRGGLPGANCDIGIRDTDLYACSQAERCDYHMQDCPDGQNCLAIDESGNTRCVASGTTGEGQPCTMATDCQRGFACVGPADGSPVCRQICNPTGGGAMCPSGRTCTALGGVPRDFGACQPMM